MNCFTCGNQLTTAELHPIPGGFRRPFRTEDIGNYIVDAEGRTACDFDDRTDVLNIQPRGWGRIHSDVLRAGGTMETAHSIMDNWEAFVVSRVANCSTIEEAVCALNRE